MNWVKVLEIRAKSRAEAEFDRIHGPRQYKTVQLPPEEWHRCASCGGSGQYLETGDLHRSSGMVPCRQCYKGTVRTKTVEIKRRVRVPYRK